jgi:hypothetical protein
MRRRSGSAAEGGVKTIALYTSVTPDLIRGPPVFPPQEEGGSPPKAGMTVKS